MPLRRSLATTNFIPTMASEAVEIPEYFRTQSIASPDAPPPGETRVFRHRDANPDFSKPPMAIPPANESHVVSTIELFRKGMKAKGANADCLGQRYPDAAGKAGPFVFDSYGKVRLGRLQVLKP